MNTKEKGFNHFQRLHTLKKEAVPAKDKPVIPPGTVQQLGIEGLGQSKTLVPRILNKAPYEDPAKIKRAERQERGGTASRGCFDKERRYTVVCNAEDLEDIRKIQFVLNLGRFGKNRTKLKEIFITMMRDYILKEGYRVAEYEAEHGEITEDMLLP